MRLLLNRYSRHGEHARSALEEVLGMRPYQVIPEDAKVVSDAMDQGLPVIKTARSSGVSRNLQTLAENIVCRTSIGSGRARARSDSLFARVLGRGATPKLEAL
jgi:pilus assembly protein CpaE